MRMCMAVLLFFSLTVVNGFGIRHPLTPTDLVLLYVLHWWTCDGNCVHLSISIFTSFSFSACQGDPALTWSDRSLDYKSIKRHRIPNYKVSTRERSEILKYISIPCHSDDYSITITKKISNRQELSDPVNTDGSRTILYHHRPTSRSLP